jgi:DNA 3'-phosphatase
MVESNSTSDSTKAARGWVRFKSCSRKNWRKLIACLSFRYRVAIISNQGGISLRPDPKIIKAEQKRVNVFKAKVGHVLNQLDIPMSVFAATAQDQFRKPRTGVWSELLEEYDLDEEEGCDRKHSFFVGDAAGRPEGADARKDFSCSDRYALEEENLLKVSRLILDKKFGCKYWHHISHSRGILPR